MGCLINSVREFLLHWIQSIGNQKVQIVHDLMDLCWGSLGIVDDCGNTFYRNYFELLCHDFQNSGKTHLLSSEPNLEHENTSWVYLYITHLLIPGVFKSALFESKQTLHPITCQLEPNPQDYHAQAEVAKKSNQ